MNIQTKHIKLFISVVSLVLVLFNSVIVFAEGAVEETIEEPITRVEFVTQRRMVFFFEAQDSFSQFEQTFIYNSIISEIYGTNPAVVILESDETTVPATFEERQELARRVFADSWVLVQVLGDSSSVTFYYETYDLLINSRIGDESIETGLRLNYRAISRGNYWDNLVETIQNNYEFLVERSDFSFTGLPGTEITQLSSDQTIIDDNGQLTIPLQNFTSYTYRATLDGYYPIQDEVLLGYDGLTINLDQRPTINWSVGIHVSNFQFFGLHIKWFMIPADFFLRLDFTTYAAGLYLIADSPNIFRYNPLSVLHLHIGFYILETEELFRPYFAFGAGLRIQHVDAIPEERREAEYQFVDPVTPAQLSLITGLEISLPDRVVRFYVEYNPIMYISTNLDEFRSGSFYSYLFEGGEIPGFVFAEDTVAFDFRNFSFGVRFGF